MKTLTWNDFQPYNPCSEAQEKYGKWDFSGTIIDILNHPQIPNLDKIWAFTRKGIVSDKTLRLFAVACAREVQHLMTDERSLKVLDVAEAFAHGKATEDELDAAWDAAAKASTAAVAWAARAATWSGAWGARAAGRSGAWEAARAAGWAAEWAADETARAAAIAKQVQIAISVIKQHEQ